MGMYVDILDSRAATCLVLFITCKQEGSRLKLILRSVPVICGAGDGIIWSGHDRMIEIIYNPTYLVDQ